MSPTWMSLLTTVICGNGNTYSQISGYYMEDGGKIRLSDGKRELLSSEASKLWKTNQAPKPCSVLSHASTNNIDVGGSQFKVFGSDCTEKRHYLCEYKGWHESLYS